jgi:hypothetical protein
MTPTGGSRSDTMGSIYPIGPSTNGLGPILAYIAEQQKKLDMSRSAKAPRRRGQKNHMFKVG